MSEKRKFPKLRLPQSKRNQITKFFSQPSDTTTNDTSDEAHVDSNTQQDVVTMPDSTEIVGEPIPKFTLESYEHSSAKLPKYRKISQSAKASITDFFNESASENDFEVPSKKQSKKPNRPTIKKPKKQPKIKNALLKREAMFSEIVAQQSLAENVDPNELQMALALSRSEVDFCNLEDDNSSACGSEKSNGLESIKNRLEEFGFKVRSNYNDYNIYLPGKIKAKWANKFTPLTLRDPEKQKEKLNKKIEQLIQNQWSNDVISEEISASPIELTSNYLRNLKAHKSTLNRHRQEYKPDELNSFYVSDLFELPTTKVGHLLKDFKHIPGRDVSPVKELQKIQNKVNLTSVNRKSINSLTVDVISCNTRATSPDLFDDSELESFSENNTEPQPDTIAKITPDACDIQKENKIDNDCVIILTSSSDSKSIKSDYNEQLLETTQHTNIAVSDNSSDVITFEKFSSDEVKTFDDCSEELCDVTINADACAKDLNCSSPSLMDKNLESDEEMIDLTQNEYDEDTGISKLHSLLVTKKDTSSSNNVSKESDVLSQESIDDCIILSDDEVNYSMNMINKTHQANDSTNSLDNISNTASTSSDSKMSNLSEPLLKEAAKNEPVNLSISFVDLIDDIEEDDVQNLPSCSFNYSNDINKEIDCFDLTQSSPETEKVLTTDTALLSNCTKLLKRFSSNKFSEFMNDNDNESLSSLDEFDKLVYDNPKVKENIAPTKEFDNLLTANIINEKEESAKEITIENATYFVKRVNIATKPDYKIMDTSTLLKELHKYGLKPFSRNKAATLLEYIYNQTHPIIVDDGNDDDDDDDKMFECNQLDVEEHEELNQCTAEHNNSNIILNLNEEEQLNQNPSKHNNFQLQDCSGECLLKSDTISAELDSENYIFQTNRRLKVATALLPLHLAWYNLVKSNEKLREALLHYEPIDLQEIYIFLKNIGYRYDPKDMKRFFDSRCIIFRYDLNDGTSNRHVRTQKIISQKRKKNA